MTLAIRTRRGFVAVRVSDTDCTVAHSPEAYRLTGCHSAFVRGTGTASIQSAARDGNALAWRTLAKLRDVHPGAERRRDLDTV